MQNYKRAQTLIGITRQAPPPPTHSFCKALTLLNLFLAPQNCPLAAILNCIPPTLPN